MFRTNALIKFIWKSNYNFKPIQNPCGVQIVRVAGEVISSIKGILSESKLATNISCQVSQTNIF